MIKLIVSDIDGTLVPEGSISLNPEYYDIIRQFQKKGITFAAASGRNMVSIAKIMHPVIKDIWAIAENGGALIHGDDITVMSPIPKTWVKEIWEEVSHMEEADSFMDSAEHTYAPFEDTDMFRYIRDGYKYDIHATGSWTQLPEEDIIMIGLYHPVDAQKYFDKHFSEKWKKHMNYLTSGINWMNLNMPDISKGNALKKLMAQLEVEPSEVICFGDNINDISMLKAAGTAMTVENARPEVKEVCDKIVPSYEEDGVLQELRSILNRLS